MAVAEAARNIVCSGGKPAAITNCLNFGNPYSPEAYWQFVGAIKGMSKACLAFKTPVTGGNVSFYNQSTIDGKTVPVLPTPTIGMIGLIESKEHITSLAIAKTGLNLILVGEHSDDISSSQYLIQYHKEQLSKSPNFDLDKEVQMQSALLAIIQSGLVSAAHDVSDGGLFTTLLEMTTTYGIGVEVNISAEGRLDGFLFGESQSRVMVAIEDDKLDQFKKEMEKATVPFSMLGKSKGDSIKINDINFGTISNLYDTYSNALHKMMS